MSCLFCKIAAGEIPAQVVHADADLIAFRDISPVAPTHILLIPREHIPTVNHLEAHHAELVGKLYLRAGELAERLGFADNGYRLVMNANRDGGQTVFHIHLHLLAGRAMQWPPG